MSTSSSFSVQLLSKIGAPLAQAVDSVPLPEGQEESLAAERMAAMVSLAVEMSIALYEKLDLTEDEKQADETRTALAAIAAEIIGNFYSYTQKLPEENDKTRILKSLEVVLSFSDKFSASGDAAARLTTISATQPLFDATQSKLVVLQSVGEIVNAVADFPFGQSENTLIQDIADRLEKDAADLAKSNGAEDKLSELMIFKGLSGIYAQCHRTETQKLSGGSQEGTPSLDPVWAAYETRLAMMNALVRGEVDVAPIPSVSSESQSPAPTETPTPAESSAPSTPPPGGPMGFFANKKKEGEGAPAPEAPVTPPLMPPPAEESKPDPAPAPQENTPSSEESSIEEKPAAPSGGPMSFFKAPPKTDDSAES